LSELNPVPADNWWRTRLRDYFAPFASLDGAPSFVRRLPVPARRRGWNEPEKQIEARRPRRGRHARRPGAAARFVLRQLGGDALAAEGRRTAMPQPPVPWTEEARQSATIARWSDNYSPSAPVCQAEPRALSTDADRFAGVVLRVLSHFRGPSTTS